MTMRQKMTVLRGVEDAPEEQKGDQSNDNHNRPSSHRQHLQPSFHGDLGGHETRVKERGDEDEIGNRQDMATDLTLA